MTLNRNKQVRKPTAEEKKTLTVDFLRIGSQTDFFTKDSNFPEITPYFIVFTVSVCSAIDIY